ncbi:PREDICTED: probable cytochrome P450 4s3, partial [Dinoponera quadriceps]|uniref:Probable cytochrome P450 4s3 n=1 Tax=Dinoponera quadriceps TaxID=609295 RepID=A0A6P3Y2W0_DINQU
MLFNHSAKWFKKRKTVLATFHMKILQTYVPQLYENSLDLVKRLGDNSNKRFNFYKYLSMIDMSLLSDLLFRFSKLAKLQQKLLCTAHSVAGIVIQVKWKGIEEKQIKNRHQNETENLTKDTEDSMNTINYK